MTGQIFSIKSLSDVSTKDTKSSLYEKVFLIKNSIGLTQENLNNFFNIISGTKLAKISFADFEAIYGVLDKTPGEFPIILISSKLKYPNFVLAHELMHLFLTPNNKGFNCTLSNKYTSDANKYEEWRANEGAAQLLMPYETFIPDYDFLSHLHNIEKTKQLLSEKYLVPTKIIEFRIKNLKNEIFQFHQGVNIEEIKIISSKIQLSSIL